MSASNRVTCDLGTGETVEARVLETVPRADRPERDLRVEFKGSTYRIEPGQIDE